MKAFSFISITALLLIVDWASNESFAEARATNAHKPEILPYIYEANKRLGKRLMDRYYPNGIGERCKSRTRDIPNDFYLGGGGRKGRKEEQNEDDDDEGESNKIPPVVPNPKPEATEFDTKKPYIIQNKNSSSSWTLEKPPTSADSIKFQPFHGTDLQSWILSEAEGKSKIYSIGSARDANFVLSAKEDGKVVVHQQENAPYQQWSLLKVPSGKFMMKSEVSLKGRSFCLTLNRRSRELELSPCDAEAKNQQFNVILKPERTASLQAVSTDADSQYLIMSPNNRVWSEDLSAKVGQPGSNLILSKWQAGALNQVFTFELQDSSEGFYFIIFKRNPSMVVQVQGHSEKENAPLQSATKSTSAPASQLFAFESVSNGQYLVRNKNSMLCVASGGPGGSLVQRSCNPNSQEQLFRFEAHKDTVPEVPIGVPCSVTNSGTQGWELEKGMPSVGADISLRSIHDVEEQGFVLEHAKDANTNLFIIKSQLDSSMVVGEGPGKTLALTLDSISKSSQWKLLPSGLGAGAHLIQNVSNGFCIEVQHKELGMAPCSAIEPNQQFKFTPRKPRPMPKLENEGVYLIKSSVGDKFLDASQAATTSGPIMASPTFLDSQKFKLKSMTSGGGKNKENESVPGSYSISAISDDSALSDANELSFISSGGQSSYFEIIPSERNTFMIKGLASKKCLALMGDGKLVKEDCQRSIAGQHFYFVPSVEVYGKPNVAIGSPIYIKYPPKDQFIGAIEGGKLVVSGKVSDDVQLFTIQEESANNAYVITLANDKKRVFGLPDNSREEGSNVVLQDFSPVWVGQSFKFRPVNDKFLIQSTHSNLCLTVKDDKIVQEPCDNANLDQQFSFTNSSSDSSPSKSSSLTK